MQTNQELALEHARMYCKRWNMTLGHIYSVENDGGIVRYWMYASECGKWRHQAMNTWLQDTTDYWN